MADDPNTPPVDPNAPKVDPPKVDPPADPPKDAPKADAPKDPPKAEPPKDPIAYTEFKAPEGMTLDAKALEGATPLFKELGLKQDQAQKLVDLYAQQVKAAGEAGAKAWTDQVAKWQGDLKSALDSADNTEFTGKGYETSGNPKLTEVTSLAAKAIDAYGGKDAPALREFMKAYAIDNHPAFARLLARVGRTVREDTLPRGPNGAPGSFDPKALYPNSPHA